MLISSQTPDHYICFINFTAWQVKDFMKCIQQINTQWNAILKNEE